MLWFSISLEMEMDLNAWVHLVTCFEVVCGPKSPCIMHMEYWKYSINKSKCPDFPFHNGQFWSNDGVYTLSTRSELMEKNVTLNILHHLIIKWTKLKQPFERLKFRQRTVQCAALHISFSIHQWKAICVEQHKYLNSMWNLTWNLRCYLHFLHPL